MFGGLLTLSGYPTRKIMHQIGVALDDRGRRTILIESVDTFLNTDIVALLILKIIVMVKHAEVCCKLYMNLCSVSTTRDL